MHPNAFLTTLWRAEVADRVFVAMSFDSRFDSRFAEVIRPAIETGPIEGLHWQAHRVDISKSGESILTEIVSGIAHARVVLADVSVIDEGRYTQIPIRNANVMYEVGIALACRTPSDVLVVRDDSKPLLFDLSTIPTLHVDFHDVPASQFKLFGPHYPTVFVRHHWSRMREFDRLQAAKSKRNECPEVAVRSPGRTCRRSIDNRDRQDLNTTERGLSGLLSKGFVRSVGLNSKTGGIFYSLTSLGRALAQAAEQHLLKLDPADRPEQPPGGGSGAA